jgi:hypothetical protein
VYGELLSPQAPHTPRCSAAVPPSRRPCSEYAHLVGVPNAWVACRGSKMCVNQWPSLGHNNCSFTTASTRESGQSNTSMAHTPRIAWAATLRTLVRTPPKQNSVPFFLYMDPGTISPCGRDLACVDDARRPAYAKARREVVRKTYSRRGAGPLLLSPTFRKSVEQRARGGRPMCVTTLVFSFPS